MSDSLTEWLTVCLKNWLTDFLTIVINYLNNWKSDRLMNDCLTNWLTVLIPDTPTDWLTVWLTDLLTVWLTDDDSLND